MSAIPPRLTAVTLGARDLPRLRDFYDALGFRRTVTVEDEFAAFLVGGRSGYVADPEGNRWEIVWVPGMEVDARGAVTKFGD